MKKLLLLPLAMVGMAIASCDNDANSTSGRSPVFGQITLTPNPCNAGDTVTGVVSYTSAGRDIYKSDYYVNVTGRSNSGDTTFVSSNWTVIDPTKSQPTFKFAAPKIAQTYTVTFGASRINYSTGGPNGELYGSANSVNTTLTVRASQTASE